MPGSWEGGVQGAVGRGRHGGGPWATVTVHPECAAMVTGSTAGRKLLWALVRSSSWGVGPVPFFIQRRQEVRMDPEEVTGRKGRKDFMQLWFSRTTPRGWDLRRVPNLGLALPQHPPLGFTCLCSRLPFFKCGLSSIAMVFSLHSACPSTSAQRGRPAYPHRCSTVYEASRGASLSGAPARKTTKAQGRASQFGFCLETGTQGPLEAISILRCSDSFDVDRGGSTL